MFADSGEIFAINFFSEFKKILKLMNNFFSNFVLQRNQYFRVTTRHIQTFSKFYKAKKSPML